MRLAGGVGSLFDFGMSVIIAVFMCCGIVEDLLISVITLNNSGVKISQNYL